MSNLNKTSKAPSTGPMQISLPEIAYTRRGIAFRPSDDVWEWVDGPFRLYIDFRRVAGSVVSFREPLKKTLLIFARGSSAGHLSNLFQAFMHFLTNRDQSVSLSSITVAEVSNYATRLTEHEKWRLGLFNVLLQKWGTLCLYGVESDCIKYLRERRKPGNVKGRAVLTRDPFNGPFSEAEYTALYKAVDVAYGTGEVSQWVAVLTRLLFACGGRISQYACLKVMDLAIRNGSFVLCLPQVKTRAAHSRMSLKEFDLSAQTGRLAKSYIDSLIAMGYGDDAALFPADVVMLRGPRVVRRANDDLFHGHCTSAALSDAFSSVLNAIAPPTERLQYAPIPVAPKRFRYTFGVRLAEEGASKATIADRLGHVDLQQVGVYVQASPNIVENIDKAIGKQLAPLARAFKGQLVEDEKHSTHKGALGSRIIDFRVSKTPLGSCAGKGGGCAFNKPVACYTCFKFEPWLDAPHEKVLLRLQVEREKWVSDERVAAINDDSILAVREVIAECAYVWKQRGQEVTL
ncbi:MULTISPECIES: site-specific integrase [unclassified Paraburkholderia]|uniref:site-specific integrase n=1 Tax=unclassified Paraburkholderia TaxID=2615204 RepID=UPI0016224227|nr:MULTISPECIES: site-specific integrase [unclassified Paraburkholderia]MBB5441580.1 integrase [Paraburkholderia sp. WSM4177]MBB5481975.1 integrase [Paraburkholderia sp. WSM4180]